MAREQVKRKPKGQAAAVEWGELVRDGARVTNDPWRFLPDEDAIPEVGDIVVSLPRLLSARAELHGRNAGRLGVLIGAGEAIEDIAEDIPHLSLIAVDFPAFRDGRGFSTARLARERYAFSGELRAVGDVLPDLIFFMIRCGFDAFAIRARDPVGEFKRAAATFSSAYQPSSDGLAPAMALRAARRGRK